MVHQIGLNLGEVELALHQISLNLREVVELELPVKTNLVEDLYTLDMHRD